jgi:nicotinamide mononucleotide transporter
MHELLTYVHHAWQQTSAWEVCAVIFAIAYVLLAIKESIWCWPAALISTLIYVFLFFDVNLYMESALQLFYIIMAIYGWIMWRKQSNSNDNLLITIWPVSKHLIAVTLICLMVLFSGFILQKNTDAAYPWLDSFTTWGAIVATWMVTKKILENWIYWFVIDSAAIYLYLQRELYLTALLFLIYVILCIIGYQQWYISYKMNIQNQQSKGAQ